MGYGGELTHRSRWSILAAAITLLAHGGALLILGMHVAPDTRTYSEWADRLLAFHFNYARYLRGADYWNVPPILYTGYVTVVAVAKLIGGASWMRLLVGLQLVEDCATAAILAFLAADDDRTIAPVVAIAFYVCSYDVVTWVRYPLTDIGFMFATFAAYALITTSSRHPERSEGSRPRSLRSFAVSAAQDDGKSTVAAFAMTFVAALMRPVGFLWLIVLIVAFAMIRWRGRIFTPVTSALLAAALCAFVAVHAYFMQFPERWPIGPLRTSVEWNARQYQRGIVVQDRYDIAHSPPRAFSDSIAISADRIVHFFAPAARRFSRPHAIAAIIDFGLLYALCIVGIGRPRALIEISLLIIIVVAVWHSLTNIDFDWRYRLPLLPHFILIASIGAERLFSSRRIHDTIAI